MKIRKIIEGFRALVGDYSTKLSTDNSWSNRLVYHHMLMCRARILYEQYNQKGKAVHAYTRQPLDCIEMCRVNQNECPCVPDSSCFFLRSVLPIPEPVDDLIFSVTAGEVVFDKVKWDDFKYKVTSRFDWERTAKYYTLKEFDGNTYLYLYNDDFKKFATISAVFTDPLDVYCFPSCDELNPPHCKDALDAEFKLEPELLPLLYQMTYEKLMTLKQNARTDILNNDNDDTSGAQTPLE